MRGFGETVLTAPSDGIPLYGHIKSQTKLLPEKDKDILNGLLFLATAQKIDAAGKLGRIVRVVKKHMPALLAIASCEGAPVDAENAWLFEELVLFYDMLKNHDWHRRSETVTWLMSALLLTGGPLPAEGKLTVYDMSIGAGTRLYAVRQAVKEVCPGVRTDCFGQEKDPFRLALVRACAVLRGEDPQNFRRGDFLADDRFVGSTFALVVAGLPEEKGWKDVEDIVFREFRADPDGRFAQGLPGINNRQALFLMNGLSKMGESGRMAILQEAGLYDRRLTGSGALSRYMVENDWLEAVIRLVREKDYRKDTCILVLNKKKPDNRKGKVQMIYAPEDPSSCADAIRYAYKEFAETENRSGTGCESRILTHAQLGYYSLVIKMPVLDASGMPVKRLGRFMYDERRPQTVTFPFSDDIRDLQDCFKKHILPKYPLARLDERRSERAYDLFGQI